jgi:hypothetical protein
MNAGAGVTSFDVLHDWYAALATFRTEADHALTEVTLALQRAGPWLGEQEQHWRREIRVCEEDVTQAKAELANRQWPDGAGNKPDTTVQEKNLRKAKARLQAAEDRLAAVRRWMLRLPREISATYEGAAGRMAHFLDADVPAGLALLSRQLTALEKYAAIQAEAPAVVVGPQAAAPTEKEKS